MMKVCVRFHYLVWLRCGVPWRFLNLKFRFWSDKTQLWSGILQAKQEPVDDIGLQLHNLGVNCKLWWFIWCSVISNNTVIIRNNLINIIYLCSFSFWSSYMIKVLLSFIKRTWFNIIIFLRYFKANITWKHYFICIELKMDFFHDSHLTFGLVCRK